MTYANKNPWISNDLKMEIAEREKLYVKYKKNPTSILRIEIFRINAVQREIIIKKNSLTSIIKRWVKLLK